MTTTANFFRKARTTNAATVSFGSFTQKIPTTTEPTTSATNGIYNLLDQSLGIGTIVNTPRYIQLVPYGIGSNNDTFDMRLWGWTETRDATPVYIPQLLLELNVTLGNIAGTAVASSTLMADTIVIAKGDLDSPEISPANDVSASILAHTRGCKYLEFDWDATSALTSMNAFWRMVDQT